MCNCDLGTSLARPRATPHGELRCFAPSLRFWENHGVGFSALAPTSRRILSIKASTTFERREEDPGVAGPFPARSLLPARLKNMRPGVWPCAGMSVVVALAPMSEKPTPSTHRTTRTDSTLNFDRFFGIGPSWQLGFLPRDTNKKEGLRDVQ